MLGVGAGRYAGEGLALAMQVRDFPTAAADAQAHNIFVQLAAELGLPLSLAVALALAVWLLRAWRNAAGGAETAAVIALALPILVHANLEHPLGYLYFLGLLGLLFGQVQGAPVGAIDAQAPRPSPELLRFASFAILSAAGLAYVQFTQVERAMKVLTDQVRTGAPPQIDRDLEARLSAVPAWSIFGDYAELITLIAVVPTAANAADLANRCERSVAFGPIAAAAGTLCHRLPGRRPDGPRVVLRERAVQGLSGRGPGADPVDDPRRADEPNGRRTPQHVR